ncbi:hypothetical protein ABID20_003906 [Rhizobium alvei]
MVRHENPIDFLLTAKRNTNAAKRRSYTAPWDRIDKNIGTCDLTTAETMENNMISAVIRVSFIRPSAEDHLNICVFDQTFLGEFHAET